MKKPDWPSRKKNSRILSLPICATSSLTAQPTLPPMPTPLLPAKFWFVLGRETLIAAAELRAVLNLSEINIMSGILIAPTNHPPIELIKQLGGTIKIAKEMVRSITEEELKKLIIEELSRRNGRDPDSPSGKKVEGKINFGLSFYASAKIEVKEIKNLGLQIKKSLKTQGYSVRYVENKEAALSSVTVEKNGLTGRGREFLILKDGQKLSLAKTEAVQPFEEFGARDFGRPGRNDVSGMLPPKLAMIMINLAQAPKDGTLLDPFCGSGTIISESLLLGYKNIIGSDITEKSVADTKLNIDWTGQRYGLKTDELKIFQSDIKDIGGRIANQSIDAIVTEPYLGAPLKGSESRQILQSQANELRALYIEAFKQFCSLLKPAGAVVFIIPRFKFKNDWITIDCKKDIELLGFKHISFLEQYPHLLYARPNQRVGREIWKFEKK